MRKDKQKPLLMAMIIANGLSLASLTSCDTPQSIAWSYYYCARDTLAAGNPYAAKHYLKACKKTVSKELTLKADSLMEVIEQTIEQRERK